MLSPPEFISTGDEYDKKDRLPDRFKGKSIMTNRIVGRPFICCKDNRFCGSLFFRLKIRSYSTGAPPFAS
jgi:hypothetical protein